METDPVFRDNAILTSKWSLQTSVVPHWKLKFQMPPFLDIGRYLREYGSWHNTLCLWIFGTSAFYSSKLAVFLELCFRKTVRMSEQIISANKHPCIYWRQTCSISLVYFLCDLAVMNTTSAVVKIRPKKNPGLCFSYIHRHLFPQLSAPCAYLVAIILTLDYETTSSIFLRINQEPHKLWLASNNYVFGDGLLYVLNDYTCTHNTLG